MDVLDPLSTVDPVAPHSSSLSSLSYLMKKSGEELISGQVVADLNEEELGGIEGDYVWWVGVGKDIGEFGSRFVASRLVHIYGYGPVLSAEGTGVYKDEESYLLCKLYLIEKGTSGEKIGNFLGFDTYARVLQKESESVHDESAWESLCSAFPHDKSLLSYYWFLQTKHSPLTPERGDAPEGLEELLERILPLEGPEPEEAKIIEDLEEEKGA